MTDSPDLSAEAARAIADGMRVVALADGEIHQLEMALIEGFAVDIPTLEVVPEDVIDSDALRDAYLRSLVMVAVADGQVSPVEEQVILQLAGAVGRDADAVSACIREVKLSFLERFAGVRHFAESVSQIAADLGLSESDVASVTAQS